MEIYIDTHFGQFNSNQPIIWTVMNCKNHIHLNIWWSLHFRVGWKLEKSKNKYSNTNKTTRVNSPSSSSTNLPCIKRKRNSFSSKTYKLLGNSVEQWKWHPCHYQSHVLSMFKSNWIKINFQNKTLCNNKHNIPLNLTCSLCSACASKSRCSAWKSFNIVVSFLRSSISALKRLLYSCKILAASFTWEKGDGDVSVTRRKSSIYIPHKLTMPYLGG